MIIVAIARGHNASTTLLVDGKVVFYVEEERLSKHKHDGSPLLGLMKCLRLR
jgi:carbamoyltransferase